MPRAGFPQSTSASRTFVASRLLRNRCQAGGLGGLERRIDAVERRGGLLLAVAEVVDADDDARAALDRALVLEARRSISRCGKPSSIAATMPPSSSISAR